MASLYPNAYDSPVAAPSTLAGPPSHESLHENEEAWIAAVQSELGLNPSGSYATVAARLADMTSIQSTATAAQAAVNAAQATTNNFFGINRPRHYTPGVNQAGTSTGTTEAVACLCTIPAQPVDGTVHATATLWVNISTGASLFLVGLRNNADNAAIAACRVQSENASPPSGIGSFQNTATLAGSILLAAGTPITLKSSITRLLGTGDASFFTDFYLNQINATFIPTL